MHTSVRCGQPLRRSRFCYCDLKEVLAEYTLWNFNRISTRARRANRSEGRRLWLAKHCREFTTREASVAEGHFVQVPGIGRQNWAVLHRRAAVVKRWRSSSVV